MIIWFLIGVYEPSDNDFPQYTLTQSYWLHVQVLSCQCKISILIVFWLPTANHSMFSAHVIVNIFCGKVDIIKPMYIVEHAIP